ncbi:cyclin-T1-3-like isoform X2 [Asparagus officinalis]|nr:cyclin-T1-3-like isoform X2 [Asparagus officinalis]
MHMGPQELRDLGTGWYFSRKYIEEKSPSRRDGISLEKEERLRKSYSRFLQELGRRLKVPHQTMATAIVFCHRFFLRQSHARNDMMVIATTCMFLAGKVEDTPCRLKDVISVTYEVIHMDDPSALSKVKQKDYERQRKLILVGEVMVLKTLGFDLYLAHPYEFLRTATKTFNVAKPALLQFGWNILNDGLCTSLHLQYKPHHIAACALFLAAKFNKVKLPSDGDLVWWREIPITASELEDISNQMLDFYEKELPKKPLKPKEAEGSTGVGTSKPASENVRAVHQSTENKANPDQNEDQNPHGEESKAEVLEQPVQDGDNDKGKTVDESLDESGKKTEIIPDLNLTESKVEGDGIEMTAEDEKQKSEEKIPDLNLKPSTPSEEQGSG